jgi:hypothetical protein
MERVCWLVRDCGFWYFETRAEQLPTVSARQIDVSGTETETETI